jgi:aspartate kinase
MRNVQVHKFGGASLADAPAFAHAVRIVGQQTGKLVVVVSAMSGTTDLLLEGAEKARVGDPKPLAAIADRLRKKHAEAARVLVPPGPVLDAILSVIDASMTELATLAQGIAIVRELTPRTKDELVARGERLPRTSSPRPCTHGHAAAYVDALQIIRTDGQFGNAAPDLKATDVATRRVILPLFKANTIPVVPGFFGATPDGQLATSDAGARTSPPSCSDAPWGRARSRLWKDVPGLLTGRPAHGARLRASSRSSTSARPRSSPITGPRRSIRAPSRRSSAGTCACASAPSPIPPPPARRSRAAAR